MPTAALYYCLLKQTFVRDLWEIQQSVFMLRTVHKPSVCILYAEKMYGSGWQRESLWCTLEERVIAMYCWRQSHCHVILKRESLLDTLGERESLLYTLDSNVGLNWCSWFEIVFVDAHWAIGTNQESRCTPEFQSRSSWWGCLLLLLLFELNLPPWIVFSAKLTVPEQQQHWKCVDILFFYEVFPSSLWAQSVITNLFCKFGYQNNSIEKCVYVLFFDEVLPYSLWAQSVIRNFFCKTAFQNNNSIEKCVDILIFNEFLPSSFLWPQSIITNVFCKTEFQNNNIESVSIYYKRSWRRRIVF